MVRLAKITKNRLGAPVWAHILYTMLAFLYCLKLKIKVETVASNMYFD